jgi:hypothetical protein
MKTENGKIKTAKYAFCLLLMLCLAFAGCNSNNNPSDPPTVNDPDNPDPNNPDPPTDTDSKLYYTRVIVPFDWLADEVSEFVTTQPFEDVDNYESTTKSDFQISLATDGISVEDDLSSYSEFYLGSIEVEYTRDDAYITVQSDGTIRYTINKPIDGVTYNHYELTHYNTAAFNEEMNKWFIGWGGWIYDLYVSSDNQSASANEESEYTPPSDISNNDGKEL